MLWTLLVVILAITFLGVGGLVLMLRSANHHARLLEYARIEAETRRAEHQIQGLVRHAFESMLTEARSHELSSPSER